MEQIPDFENKDEQKKELIKALKENKENAQELLQKWLKEKEALKSEDQGLDSIKVNVARAKLYFEVGTDNSLEEAYDSYWDVIEQAHNEGRDKVEEILRKKGKQDFPDTDWGI